MPLGFPNQSRSFDGHRVRFWGHDGALEISFFLDESAIFKLYPLTQNVEAAILAAFDAARERIHAVAGKLYSPKQRRSFYVLAATDF